MSKWTRVTLFSLLFFLCVTAQDANWGKKVKCYMVDGTTICPGCNSRAGLTCPRIVIPDENKCDSSPPTTTKAPLDDKGSEEEETTDSSVIDAEVTDSNEPIETTFDAEITTPDTTISQDENIIAPKPTPNLLDMHIYLYQILRNSAAKNPYFDVPRRLKRKAEIEDDTCRWNGDCPCPQICCRNGEDRPKTCKMGIRLPPPWG